MLDWGLHIGCKARYRVPFNPEDRVGEGIVVGVQEYKDHGYIEINHTSYSTTFCTPVVIPLERVTDEDKLEFQKSFCPEYIIVQGFYMEDGVVKIQHNDTRSLSSMEKIYDDIFSEMECDFAKTRFLTKKGYNCGQFPEGSYILEERNNG